MRARVYAFELISQSFRKKRIGEWASLYEIPYNFVFMEHAIGLKARQVIIEGRNNISSLIYQAKTPRLRNSSNFLEVNQFS